MYRYIDIVGISDIESGGNMGISEHLVDPWGFPWRRLPPEKHDFSAALTRFLTWVHSRSHARCTHARSLLQDLLHSSLSYQSPNFRDHVSFREVLLRQDEPAHVCVARSSCTVRSSSSRAAVKSTMICSSDLQWNERFNISKRKEKVSVVRCCTSRQNLIIDI